MKTLITGVSSEIGRGIAHALVNNGHDVVGYDTNFVNDIPAAVEFVQADVRDLPKLTKHADG